MLSSIIAYIKGSSSVVQLACLDFGIQWGLWTVSAALHTEKFYDLAGELLGRPKCPPLTHVTHTHTSHTVIAVREVPSDG